MFHSYPPRRLFSSSLPEFRRLLRLVKDYFRNIHPLRSFGFIHKPSFMQRLEDQSEPEHNNDILLLVVCALGAKCVFTRSSPIVHQWADNST